MYEIIGTQTRPNTQVPFLTKDSGVIPAEVYEYVRENYLVTNKILSQSTTISEDQLTLTSTRFWSNEAAFDEFMADTYIIENLVNPGNAYLDQNGILRDRSVNTNS